MAKKWYPVVDYVRCIECGTCVENCPHDVYDKSKYPSPIVEKPQECVNHCHGCGNRCPVGAITYIGDNTGWTPPNSKNIENQTSCCSTEVNVNDKRVLIEYLYLDLQTCDRCMGTDAILDEVLLTLIPALEMAGFKVEINKIEIATAKLAEKHRFLSSPTIRVNGRDICKSVEENSCGCCSEISVSSVNCRVYEYNGEKYEVPPKEMIAEAILKKVFGQHIQGCSCSEYMLPENLKSFFDGKENKPKCSCIGSCC